MIFQLNETISILERTPAVLKAYLSGLNSFWTNSDYGKGTWSVHQVLGHLIWGERTDWIPRIHHMIENGSSVPFVPFDREGHKTLCSENSTKQLLTFFVQEREENIRVLRSLNLTDRELNFIGQHPGLGPISMKNLLAAWTVHDMNHIAQISKAMSFQYFEAVGPWDEYLSILAPPNPR